MSTQLKNKPLIRQKRTLVNQLLLLSILLASLSCHQKRTDQNATPDKGTYGYDAAFLKAHLKQVTELRNSEGARVLVTGDFQGRVMTSSASGESGNSFGWINYDLIESKKKQQQFNPVGGEERFWLGPEGGQFSLYFKKGDTFDFKHWQVPPFIDQHHYATTSSGDDHVTFSHQASVENYSGSTFDVQVTRTIRLLGGQRLAEKIGAQIPENIRWVAYETENNVKNRGNNEWTKETGLLSVWLLGMFTPSDETVAIIPFKNTATSGSYITDDYFGQIPTDRLIRKDSVLLLKCDGKHRSKLGISPAVAKPMAGSFDYQKNILTVILFTVEPDEAYVNSKWELQDQPFEGDVVNAYNDGPLEDGTQMGPFYELESSSAAKPLKPGESLTYKQVTCHFEGDYASLNNVAQGLLGVDLDTAKLP